MLTNNQRQHHDNIMLDTIRELIQWKVEQALPALPANVTKPKISLLLKYKGLSDYYQFYDWLDKYLGWLRCHNLCGPDTDKTQLNYVEGMLGGKALSWYHSEIDNPRRLQQWNWSRMLFEAVMCVMHDQFVQSNTASKAKADYDDIRYVLAHSVKRFYTKIWKYVDRLVNELSEYEIRKKFFEGLPDEIHDALLTNRGITAEYTTLEVIRVAAQEIEETNFQLKG